MSPSKDYGWINVTNSKVFNLAGVCNRVSDRLLDRSGLFLSQGSRHGTGSSPSPGCCWYNGKCDSFSNPIDLLAPIETKMKGG